MLEPTTGIANRMAITSTASVEKPSIKAMIHAGNASPGPGVAVVCTPPLWREGLNAGLVKDALRQAGPLGRSQRLLNDGFAVAVYPGGPNLVLTQTRHAPGQNECGEGVLQVLPAGHLDHGRERAVAD